MLEALRRFPGAAAWALFAGLALVGYGFLFTPGATPYSPHSDMVAYSLALKQGLFAAWSAGADALPFWQPSQVSGGVLLTNPQALAFYPLGFPFFVLPPSAALGPTFFLHFFVAAVVFYALGRELGLSRRAACVMGIAGLFNAKLLLAAYAGWLPLLPSIVLSPLLALCVLRLVRVPTLGRATAFAVVAATCLCSGHIQIVYYTSLGCGVMLAHWAIQRVRAHAGAGVTRVVGLLAAGSLLAFGLSAYLWLPVIAELPMISRSRTTYEFFLSGHGTTLAHLATLLHPEALGTPLEGGALELWEDLAYFGIVPLLLAAYAWLSGEKRELVRPLGIAFVLSILLAMDTPILRGLWLVLPGMSMFHCPSRLLFVSSFLGITLAGVGFDALLVRVSAPRTQWLAWCAVALVMSGEGVHYARRYLEMRPASEVLPSTAYGKLLRADTSLFRVAPVGRATINAGWAAHQGLELITGYEPYNLRHYATYFDVMTRGMPGPDAAHAWFDLERIARPDLLDALNVKYLVAPVPLQFPGERFRLHARLGPQPMFEFYGKLFRAPIFIYQRVTPRARAFFVPAVLGVRDEASALRALASRSIDALAITEQTRVGSEASPPGPADRLDVRRRHPGQLSLQVSCSARRFVVISEVWHPGWRARIDGHALALQRTNYALLGAWVPPGSHRIELELEPLHFAVAQRVSLAALALLGLTLLVSARLP